MPVHLPAAVAAVIAVFMTVSVSWIRYNAVEAEYRSDTRIRAALAAKSIKHSAHEVVSSMLAARGLVAGSQDVDPDEWQVFVAETCGEGRGKAAVGFGYLHRVPNDQRPAFVESMRNLGLAEFEIHGSEPDSTHGYAAVVRSFAPLDGNEPVIGYDVSNRHQTRSALERAARTNTASATGGIRLQHAAYDGWAVEVVLPIYDRDVAALPPSRRLEATVGWVGALIDTNALLAIAAPEGSGLVHAKLYDVQDRSQRVLATVGDPQARGSAWHDAIDVHIGGKTWTLDVAHETPAVGTLLARTLPVTVTAAALGVTVVIMLSTLSGASRRATWLAEGMTAMLRESEERVKLAVKGSRDGLWDWNLSTDTVHYATRWKELLGCSHEPITDSPEEFFSRVKPEMRQAFKEALARHIEGETSTFDQAIEMTHADGSSRWMLCRAQAVRNEAGRAVRVAGAISDIDDLKTAQDRLRHSALHDRLTDLPNRQLLTERLRQSIARCQDDVSHRFAVLFFDFDRFKVVNDSLGHSVGDALLISIADRFRAHIGDNATAARFGGDEFVLLVDGISGTDEGKRICEHFLDVFAEPHVIDGHEVVSTASIGLVSSEGRDDTAEDILRDADAAMYEAKRSGKARYRLFDAELHEAALLRLQLEYDLRHASFDEQCEVYYQPIVCLRTGELAGFEALLRWNHPKIGYLSPDLFVTIAEETGLIVPLGDWILRTAARDLHQWQQLGERGRGIFMNVNLSKRQLLEPGLPDRLVELIREADVIDGSLKLEITETIIMDHQHELVSIMRDIRERGVRLAMDDFGTGHSSLSCLHDFPIDVLKIDRSFVVNLEGRRQFAAVLHAIITLAQHLDMEVVAEGVEDRVQLAQLQSMDCSYAQGYLFSKPVSAADARTLVLEGISVADAA